MKRDGEPESTEPTTLQRLEGGRQWHCTDLSCRWVSAADLELAGPTKTVRWDDDEHVLRVVGEEEPMGLANVCNQCRSTKGWDPAWLG